MIALLGTIYAAPALAQSGSAAAPGSTGAPAASSASTAPPGSTAPPATTTTAPAGSTAPPAGSTTAPAASPTAAPVAPAVPAAPLAPIHAGEGRLRVVVNRPNTHVFIDGEPIGDAPLERDLHPGVHRVRVESFGQRTWETSLEIMPGFLTPLRVFLRPTPSRSSAWTVSAVSALLLAGGTAIGVWSNLDRAALSDARDAGRLDNRDLRIERGETLAGLADATFVLGAVVAAFGVYFFAHDPGPPSIGRASPRRALPVLP